MKFGPNKRKDKDVCINRGYWRSQDFGSSVRGEETLVGVGIVEGPRTSDAGEFSKVFKRFLKKIANMNYFSIFFKSFTNHELIFRAFG